MVIVACCRKNGRSFIYIFLSSFLYIYIINYYIDRKKPEQSATNYLKLLVLLHFPCCRNCCKLLHLLQKLLQKLLQICCTCCRNCCKLLHHPFIVSCNNLQQVIFYHFFISATENVQPHATVSATHIYSRYCIFIHLQQFLQQIFSLISL